MLSRHTGGLVGVLTPKSLKRHVDYTGPVLFLTRYIHALCCLAL